MIMSTSYELALSPAYKRSQRALSRWLDHDANGQPTLFRARAAFKALSGNERTQLARWLDALAYAARCNNNQPLLARVERLQARLQQYAPRVRTRVSVTPMPAALPTHGLLRSA